MKKILSLLLAILIPVFVGNGVVLAGSSGDIFAAGDSSNEVRMDSSGNILQSAGYIQQTEISAPSGNPASNKGWIYIKDNGGTSALYFEDDAGTVAQIGAASVAWDDIGDPDANSSITFGTYTNVFTGAATAADQHTIENTGNMGNVSILVVEQKTGNPTDGTAFEVKTADTNIDGVVVTNSTADLTANTTLLTLGYTDDGDANGAFINCLDNASADSKFLVDADGAVTCGALNPTGAVSLTGALTIGIDGTGHDVIIYSDTVGDNITFNDTEKVANFTDYEIQLNDGNIINFGTGALGTGDYTISSNGTDLSILATADVASQALVIGDDTNDMDILWEGNTNSSIVRFDSSADQVVVDGVDIYLGDSDYVLFGDGAASNGDFSMMSTGATSLAIVAVANTAATTLTLGDVDNHFDMTWQSTTASDVVTFDWDNTQITQTDVNTAIADSTAFADNTSALTVTTSGNKAAGGATLILTQTAGAPNAGSFLLELVGTGLDQQGIFADVDGATNNVYTFHSGGAIAAAMSVLTVTSDGTPAASTSKIASISFTGDDANTPIGLQITGSGTGIDITGIDMLTQSNGTTAWNMNLTNAASDALGVSLRTHHDSTTPAAADEIFFHTILGEDAGGAATEYVRLSAQSLLPTAGQEDGEYVISVAADNGTLTRALCVGPQLNSANTGISVGSGAGTAAVTSEGAYDLILQTNYGTNSGVITITDAADQSITLTPNGTGNVVAEADTLVVGDAAAAAKVTSNGAGNLTIDTNDGTNSGSILIAQGASGDITINPDTNGSLIAYDAAIQWQVRAVAAGTAADSPDVNDGIVQVATDGAQACTVTLPEAASNLGLELTIAFITDGGQDVTIARTGADTIDENGDAGNTSVTMGEAKDYIILRAVSDDSWMVVKNNNCVLT